MSGNNDFLKRFMQDVDLNIFTPSLYSFVEDFLSIERARRFGSQYVISTFIPPFPGKAFDRFLGMFEGEGKQTTINSVDLAVTNACMFNCRHCYNSGRLIADASTDELKKLVTQLQHIGAFVINFTGGEPCLRHDLPEICEALNEDTAAILSTTGYGFTHDLAKRLKHGGIYAVSISLDSDDEKKHDHTRNTKGAFQIALRAIETALENGFYTYTCVVPSKETLEEDNFRRLYEFNRRLGVHEIQILEPAPAGKLLHSSNLLEPDDFESILRYMKEYNCNENGPAISSFAHLESPEFFGCGAGFSHIYVDGSGEVSPCNMTPVSYGNAYSEGLETIIERMQDALGQPCRACRAYAQREYFQKTPRRGQLIGLPDSLSIPEFRDGLPRFYEILDSEKDEMAGSREIQAGYSTASETYDDYWLTVASKPIDDLFRDINIPEGAAAIDCGCGTGYTTAKLAEKTGSGSRIIGIDLTERMVEKARKRFANMNFDGVRFRIGDVLSELGTLDSESIDIATLTWLIGYVGCDDIFTELRRVIKPGGQIAFVAHLDRSPKMPFDMFEELIRENPGVMKKTVRMQFPLDERDIRASLQKSGFEIVMLKTGTFTVVCRDGSEIYDHVMKSGAGSTFYHSIHESERARLCGEFIKKIDLRFGSPDGIPVEHHYVAGIAVK